MKNKNITPWYRQSVYKQNIGLSTDKSQTEIDFIVIGDIHGCWNTLMDLLNFAEKNIPNFKEYTIISVGDITNKGGEKASISGNIENSGSVNVLRWAISQYNNKKLLIVDSNHGRNIIRRIKNKKVSKNPNVEITYNDIMLQSDNEDLLDKTLNFLESLPPFIKVKSKKDKEYIIAHASASERLIIQDSLTKAEYDYFLYNNYDFKWSLKSTVITGHVGVSSPKRIQTKYSEIIRLDTKVETGNGLSFYDSVSDNIVTIPTNKKDLL